MKSEENKLAYKQKRTQQINKKYKNKRKQKNEKINVIHAALYSFYVGLSIGIDCLIL